MKQVKLILSTALIFICIATGIVFNACIKDPCADISCKNNGVCRDGRCKCPIGFEGPYCTERMYEKFIGTYQGAYRCNGNIPDNRMVIIAPGAKAYDISIYNIFAQNDALNATVDGDKIVVAEQTVNNIVFKGTGFVEGLYITMYIEEKDNSTGVYSSCVLNATKFIQP